LAARWRAAARLVWLLGVIGPAGAVEAPPESLSIRPGAEGEMVLGWQTAWQRPYQAEASPDLTSWSELGPVCVGDGLLREMAVPCAGARQFYRLRIGAVRTGFDQVAMSREDDHSYPQPQGAAALVPIGFPVNFFGATHTACFINNNGNITFDNPLVSYTPENLINQGSVMIAPYWADVDTRSLASEVTRFSDQPGLVDDHRAFGVTWRNVGYFSYHDDKLNSFQLVLIERADRNPGDFDVEFNYNRIQWETGDASGGSWGFGGSPARVGWTNGHGSFMEYRGSGETRALLDTLEGGDPNWVGGLIYQAWNSGVPGRILVPVVNGVPQTEPGLSFAVNAGVDQLLPASAGRRHTHAGTLLPPDTTGVTYTWVCESGPLEPSFTAVNSLTTEVQIPEPGRYVFRLRGNKQQTFKISASDTMTLDHPGTFEVFAGNYWRNANDPLTVPLNSAVARFNGQPLASVQWTQTEGPGTASILYPKEINPTVVLPTSGTYRFELRAATSHTLPFVKTAEALVVHGN
jgi:hypothetical protein